MRVRFAFIAFIAFMALAAGSCGGAEPASEGTLEVVASFYPLAEAAERIGGDRVRVTNLTPAGAEPHDIELTSAQLDRVIDADVVLLLGGGFQPALEEAAEKAEGVVIDVLSGGKDILEDEEEHGDEEEEDEHGHDGGVDPHIWLDPVRWADVVERIGDAMAGADEEAGGEYADRTHTYARALRDIDDDFEDGLADCERDLLVTSHDAFSYLGARYGLRVESVSGISPEAEPDPGRFADLADLVEREGVTTIYTETLVSPKVAETLAREAGIEVATLDPIEGLSPEQIERGEDYISVMRGNLAALRKGLGCR